MKASDAWWESAALGQDSQLENCGSVTDRQGLTHRPHWGLHCARGAGLKGKGA